MITASSSVTDIGRKEAKYDKKKIVDKKDVHTLCAPEMNAQLEKNHRKEVAIIFH